MGTRRKQSAKAAAGLVGDPSSLPLSFFTFLERVPDSIEHTLSSDDASATKSLMQALVQYLRERGQQLPPLAIMADWLDPNAADSEWQLILRRRKRGRRRSIEQRSADLDLKIEADQLTAELRAKGQRSPRKKALGEVATRHGLSDKGLQAAIARTDKELLKLRRHR